MTYVAAFYHAFAGDQKVQFVNIFVMRFAFDIIKIRRSSAYIFIFFNLPVFYFLP